MTVFFTSDPHFGHQFVSQLRGHGITAFHDLAICENWQRQVKPDDIVWVLGDLCMNNPSWALSLLDGLPGRKRLIVGNHDKIHPMHRDAWKFTKQYHEVFEFVAPFARTKVCGTEVMLSHFPYEADRGEARYMQYRLRNEGLPLLHGHTHGQERVAIDYDSNTIEIHVGLDAWDLKLVTDSQVAELLALRPE